MIDLPEPRRIALDSGAILLYQKNTVSSTTAFGAWVRKGSRDEGEDERGMSHVLEHMVFRGTPSRSGLDIALLLRLLRKRYPLFWRTHTGKRLERDVDVRCKLCGLRKVL